MSRRPIVNKQDMRLREARVHSTPVWFDYLLRLIHLLPIKKLPVFGFAAEQEVSVQSLWHEMIDLYLEHSDFNGCGTVGEFHPRFPHI